MSQLDALLFTVQAILACSFIVGIAVFVRALMYEWQARRDHKKILERVRWYA